jgi:hypothetical protein
MVLHLMFQTQLCYNNKAQEIFMLFYDLYELG